MDSVKQLRAMTAHYKKATAEPSECFKHYFDTENCIWYVLFWNLQGSHEEFTGGEYIFEFRPSSDYPCSPPLFTVMTPNGVFDINTSVCVSNGIYHAENYNPVRGIWGFIENLFNGWYCWQQLSEGKGHVSTTIEEKKQLAAASAAYNKHHYADLRGLIDETYTRYSAAWKK
jgi:ubiquitin-protein ligase